MKAIDQILFYDLVFSLIKKENRYFESLVGQGIFYPPELYLAVQIGKYLKENSEEIFGEDLDWVRETNLANSNGPVDLVFEKGGIPQVAIELKIRQTYTAYISDIQKLKKTEAKCKKYFIALIDSFKSSNEKGMDERVIKIEAECSNDIQRLVPDFNYFEVKEERYSKDIICLLGIWEVNSL